MSNLLSPLKTIAAFAALAFVLSGCVHHHGRNHYRSSYGYEHNHHPRQHYWQGHDYYHNHNYQRR